MIGQRTTRQRTAISALLEGLAEFRSAQQVHGLLAAEGESIGLATVYRALGAMAAAGELDVLRTDAGETLYRRCARPDSHHHHLVCRVCGRTEEVAVPNLERLVGAIGAQHGYTRVEHTLELFGTCAACVGASAGG